MYHSLFFNIHSLGAKRPSGPHRIASFLREQEWDCEVIDFATIFNLEELKELAKMRINKKTVFIGFSCFFAHWEDKFDHLIDWIKKTYPNVSIIVGGQSRPRINSTGVDYYIHGYGEIAILELVKHLIGNSSSKIAFDPLFFGEKKVITANKTYPAFPMKSLRIKYEERDYIQPWEWLTIEFAFGHFYGIESMNSSTLKIIGKGMAPEKIQNGLLEAKEYFSKNGDYRASMGIVIGLPQETIESQLQTLRWVERNWKGQSVAVWPLEIPLDPKMDVLSSISEDYKSYGYRPSNKPIPPEPEEFLPFGGKITRVKHGTSNLNWENDNMSFSDACNISNDWYLKVFRKELDLGVGMFAFGDYMLYGGMSRKEVLKLHQTILPPHTTINDNFYKSKKLR